MARERPVVVYAASGYTGSLICEALAGRSIPFVAAGRSRDRLERMLADLPDADAEPVEVEHTSEALAGVFERAAVVVNVAGPFAQLGEPVLSAALRARCHYVDTTGEQDYLLRVARDHHAGFERAKLALVPSCAWMWALGACAAEICLETEGVDSLDVVYHPNGLPSIASMKSFLRMICRTNRFLEHGVLQEWPRRGETIGVTVPGTHRTLRALPWGGGGEPVWFLHDSRVRSCRVLVTVPDGPATDFLLNAVEQFERKSHTLSDGELEKLTNSWGDMAGQTPPRESPEVNRYVVAAWGRGTTVMTRSVLSGAAPYLQTGVLCAYASEHLLDGEVDRFGFTSPPRAFGARRLLRALHEAGLSCTPPAAGDPADRST